ncbi:unnamed protein product, partial [Polarella glacialis]
VLNEEMRWIAFCGCAGLTEPPKPRGPAFSAASEPPERRFCGLYSYGYLLQLLTCQEMPENLEGFREVLDLFFPRRCDLAEHLHQLPHMSVRDPADPQKRPLFCSSQHCMDGFFRLPEAVRRAAFDKVEPVVVPEAVLAAGNASRRRQNRRRHKGDRDDAVTTNGTHTNGHESSNGANGVK